jgi:lipopolysaccharide export system protein LptA
MGGIIGFLILGVALSPAYAENGYFTLGEGPNKLQPKADHLSMLPEQWIWEGNVKVIQGNITLTCDKLVVVWDTNEATAPKGGRKSPGSWSTARKIKSITASGNVKILQDDRMATAGKAFWDGVNRIIKLTDNPRIWQGRDAGIANAIIMYLDENRWEFQGDDGNPIKFTIHPSELKNRKQK